MKEKKKTRVGKLFKRQVLVTVLCVAVVVAVTLVASYAIFSKVKFGTEYNVVYTGNLSFSYVDLSEEGNVLGLVSTYPISDSEATKLTPFRFSVENTGTLVAKYTVKIVEDTATINADGCSDNLLDLSYLRYTFDKGEVKDLKSSVSPSNEKEFIVYEGTLQPFESNIHEIFLWISENSPNSVLGTHYHGKVIVEIEQAEGSNPYERPEDNRMKVADIFNQENLGDTCGTYDDGVDTFFVGQCANNYLWYSGKLWRIVLKNNETGAVKMVTDNAITTIPYHSDNQTSFENSYADQWLNQEFLPTLHDYQNYLVENSTWDATVDSSDTPIRPNGTTIVKRTVGLLNAYEYFTTYNHSEGKATMETGYLNNATRFWLITPYSSSDVRVVWHDGTFTTNSRESFGSGAGIKPSVYLQSDISIVSGDGSTTSPFRLIHDEKTVENGITLLSTRYIGEYVRFNNSLYRIVGVENGLTKITAVSKPENLIETQFHHERVILTFADANIKNDLESYYQNLDEQFKRLVEVNTSWYLGSVESNASYKNSICASVDANISTLHCEKTNLMTSATIGLPRVGEMFSSQIAKEKKENFWTLTPSFSYYIRHINAGGGLNDNSAVSTYGARPSMYLKSNVVIARNNTGDGTYEHPYEIELG